MSFPVQSFIDVCSWGALSKEVDSHGADISVVLIYLQKQLDYYYLTVQVQMQSWNEVSDLSETSCSALLRITEQHISVFHSLLL